MGKEGVSGIAFFGGSFSSASKFGSSKDNGGGSAKPVTTEANSNTSEANAIRDIIGLLRREIERVLGLYRC